MARTFLLCGFVCALAGGLAAPVRPVAVAGQPAAQVIEINAERFSFTPSEFRVKSDAPVEIRLRSDDTDHGFHILGTDIKIVIPKRGKGAATVTFQPPKPTICLQMPNPCGARVHARHLIAE